MDMALLVGPVLLTAVMAWMGIRASLKPVPPDKAGRQELWFLLLAAATIGLQIWSGVRSSSAQAELRETVLKANGAADSARDEARTAKEETQAARRDLAAAKAEINTNVTQYRTDTSNAVSRILRPPRSITTEQRAQLRTALVGLGPHEVGLRHAQGSDEAEVYRIELSQVFTDAGWMLKPLDRIRLLVWGNQGHGLMVMESEASGPPKDLADQVEGALKSAGLEVSGRVIAPIDSGVELYIALQ
jgi:hypothetical protein